MGERCWCTIAAEQPGEDWPKCQRCHTFVGCNGAQPGEITFLGDCTHALAGKTLPMADLPPFMSTEA